MEKDSLRTREVSEILGLPPRTVTWLAKQKRLPTKERLGGEGYYRYPADQIMELKKRSQSTEIGPSSLQPERGRSEVGIDDPETDLGYQYEDSPVAGFLPLLRVLARSGMKGGVYGGELKGKQNDIGMTKQQQPEVLLASGPLNPDGVEDVSLLPVLGMGKSGRTPLPSFLKRHIEFMERIVNGEGDCAQI